MRARNLDRRLDAAGRRLCDVAYERFARLVTGQHSMTPADEREAARLLRLLDAGPARRRPGRVDHTGAVEDQACA